MADAPSLAEQWSLKVKEDKSSKSEISIEETADSGVSADASEEVVPVETTEHPVSDESTPAAEEITEAPEQEETAAEETTEAPEPEETAVEEDAEETPEERPEIKLETAPADFRFPTTNQTRHCFTRYIEYHRCVAKEGDGAPECDKFAKYYRALCPGEWIERWNEQRENGTFPGKI